MTFAVCVFCASSEGASKELRQLGADLGEAIAAEGWHLVYGGGNVGLMGELARACLDAGGSVTGIIPEMLSTKEIALDRVSELVTVETMRQRKQLMDERADAFVALPGGIGTLEELVEVLTLKQLGYHERAIVVVDDHGFWDPFIDQLATMANANLASPALGDLFAVVPGVPEAIEALRREESAGRTAGGGPATAFKGPTDGQAASG